MNDKPYTLLAIFQAKPGKEKALQALLSALVPPTLQEEGCMTYQLHQSSTLPGQFMFYETWANKEAHAAHCQTPHLQAFRAQRQDILAEAGNFSSWEIIA